MKVSTPKPFRTLHIIASVDREGGGPIQALIQTLASLPPGQEIETVSLDTPDAPWIAIFPGTVHGMGPAPSRYGYTPKLTRWIVENGHRFDAAVIHGLWNHASVGGWQGCQKSGLPYVIFTHGMMDPWFRKTYPIKHWAKQLFWLVQGRALRDASEVLFTCEEEQRLAARAFLGYRYRPRVVAFAAEDAPPPAPGDEAAFKRAVPKLGDRPYLLFISRIHEKKGCDLLIEAFARAALRAELQLVVAGPSHRDLAERLQKLAVALGIADRLHWPGMIQGAAKAGAFRGAEAFVLTSHQENFGIAVAEALAYERPVLISNQINIWREIETGGAGLVAPDTVDGAVQLLNAWEALTPKDRADMGRAARVVYVENFTVEAAARDLTSALHLAAQSRRSPAT